MAGITRINHNFVDGNELTVSKKDIPLEAMLTSAEIIGLSEIMKLSSLSDNNIGLPNYALYAVEQGRAVVYIGHKPGCGEVVRFRSLKNLETLPKVNELVRVLSSRSVHFKRIKDERYATKFDLEALSLTIVYDTFSYLDINTSNLNVGLTDAQKELLKAVYGGNYMSFMERLAERRQNSVRMCLLAPTFVLEQAAEKPFLVQCSFQPHFDFRGDIPPRDAYSVIFYKS